MRALAHESRRSIVPFITQDHKPAHVIDSLAQHLADQPGMPCHASSSQVPPSNPLHCHVFPTIKDGLDSPHQKNNGITHH